MKIFINIASYRDPLLANTINDAYNNARYNAALVFGVVEQALPDEALKLDSFKFRRQIKYLRVDPEYARGACWPRNVAQSYWSGEDYYLQIDSHTLFEKGWDESLINQYNELRQYHNKPVISSYAHIFSAHNNDISNLQKTKLSGLLTLVVDPKGFSADKTDYFVQPKAHIVDRPKFTHGFLVSGHFLFTNGNICQDVPYDPYMYFSGEEPSYALRLWTSGYNIFHTLDLPLYTYYGNSYRPVSWGDKEELRSIKWWEYDKRSKERLLKVVTGVDTSIYCLGTERTLDQYKNWSGIDYVTRTLMPNATTGVNTLALDYKLPIPL